MKSILNTTTKRRITLLNLLFVMLNRINLDSLAKHLNTSKKNILSDIEFFQENWPNIVSITYNSATGIGLQEAKNQSVQTIYNDILKESQEFQLLEGIFFEPGQNGKYWEDKLFISTSSLYRMSLRIEKALKGYGVVLQKNPYNLIAQNEVDFRALFRTYFIETYGYEEWPFDFEKNSLTALMRQISADFDLALNESQINDQAYTLAILLLRVKQGHLSEFKKSIETAELMEYGKLFEYYIQQLPEDFIELFENQHEATRDFVQSVLWWKFAWDNQEEANRIRRTANEFIDQVVDESELEIDDFSRMRIKNIFLGSYLRHKVSAAPRYILYNREHFSKLSIESTYPFFYSVFKHNFSCVQKKNKIPWLVNYFDEILAKIMVQWEKLPLLIEGTRPQIDVVIFSDLGEHHAKSVAEYLQPLFFNRAKIAFAKNDYISAKPCDVPDCDIYLANYVMKNVPQEKLFVVEDIPTYRNLADLRSEVDGQLRNISAEAVSNYEETLR